MSKIGNQYGIKIKDPALRQQAYKSFCEHIAKGYCIESWHFEHPEATLSYKTMLKYIKDEDEFPPIHKEIAEAKSLKAWEDIVYSSAKGENKKANTASLQMIMRNKFGWDKPTDKQPIESTEVVANFEKMQEQLTTLQKSGGAFTYIRTEESSTPPQNSPKTDENCA